jgi:cytoskeletal protein RodZ
MCYGMRLTAPIVFIFVGILSCLVWQIHYAIHAVNSFFPAATRRTQLVI